MHLSEGNLKTAQGNLPLETLGALLLRYVLNGDIGSFLFKKFLLYVRLSQS